MWKFLVYAIIFVPSALISHLQNEYLDSKWDEFQKALNWCVEKEKPHPLYIPEGSNEEEQELSRYFHAKAEAKYNELESKLKEMHEQFSIFSGKLADVIAMQGEGNYSDFLYNKTYESVMAWYMSFMEQNFYQDWQSAYGAIRGQKGGDIPQ
ncbi:MAG: hypothetical protein H7A40_02420 [Chlamydiales bacterium]|nr:hypothetical protein [Chlamydiales bacterium]